MTSSDRGMRLRHLLVTRRWAPRILAAAKNEGRAGNLGQQLRGVGTCQQGALLRFENFDGLALDHVEDRVDEGPVIQPFGMDHGTQPLLAHRTHAASACELDEFHPSDPLSLTDVVLRPGLVARVEKGESAYAVTRTSVDLERDATAHRMPDNHEITWCLLQDGVGHRRQ